MGHPALDLSFFLWFGGTFPLLRIHRSKVSLLLFKLLLDLDGVSVHCAEQGDIQELHLLLDVSIYATAVLEYQMFLRTLDTQLRVKGMKNIAKLQHILVPSLSKHGPLYVFVLVAFDKVVLLLDGIPE